jgi:cytochrome P450
MIINLTSEEVRRNPYPAYDEVRRAGHAVYDPQRNLWSVGRYDDVFEVLRNNETFSNKVTGVESTLGGADGKVHTHARNIVRAAFSAERIAALDKAIRSLAEKLAKRIEGKDKCEFMGDFAVLIPTTVIAWMLGIDDTRPGDLYRWSTAIIASAGARRHAKKSTRPGALRRWLEAVIARTGTGWLINKKHTDIMNEVAECEAFLMDHFNRAIQNPGGGWLIDLLVNDSDSDRLSMKELIDISFLMITAGTETTTDLIGNAGLLLATNPQIQDHIRANPQLLESFIEEVLRFDSPVQRRPRIAKRHVKIGDIEIPEGSQIEALIGSANRDPEKFPDADQFRFDRDPNRHITFGAGPHFCLGAQLARLEANAALEVLIRKLPKMTLACPVEDLIYPEMLTMRGPQQLPIKFG